jgi:hypothetical protein
MWQALMDWLPDLQRGTLEVRDIVGLTVAGLALLLSWYAIRMAKRQEGIALEQAAIAKRQAEIAETQHRIMQEQLAAKAHLVMDYDIVTLSASIGTGRHRFFVSNTGRRTAHDFSWEFYIPADFADKVTIDIPGAAVVPHLVRIQGQHGMFRAVAGRSNQKVYPQRQQEIGDITARADIGGITFHYVIVAEDGVFSGPIEF